MAGHLILRARRIRAVFEQSAFQVGGQRPFTSLKPPLPHRGDGSGAVQNWYMSRVHTELWRKSSGSVHRWCPWLRTPSPNLTSRNGLCGRSSPSTTQILDQRESSGEGVSTVLWAVLTAVQEYRLFQHRLSVTWRGDPVRGRICFYLFKRRPLGLQSFL